MHGYRLWYAVANGIVKWAVKNYQAVLKDMKYYPDYYVMITAIMGMKEFLTSIDTLS